MKPTASLLGLALLFFPVNVTSAQTQNPTAAITVIRTDKGCDITLSPVIISTVQDQVWPVIDGKSEGFGGGDYISDDSEKPLHLVVSVSDDLDKQVKDIFKAQGILFKSSVTTYHIVCGLNAPNNFSVSKSLIFRHESNILSNASLPLTATYKVGEKITVYEGVALDSGMTTSGILGKSTETQNQLPHDLLHRITIQVQFVPKKSP